MEYQANRGGKVVFKDIAKPNQMEWGSPLDAMKAALELEKTVNQSLLNLHSTAGNHNDAHTLAVPGLEDAESDHILGVLLRIERLVVFAVGPLPGQADAEPVGGNDGGHADGTSDQ